MKPTELLPEERVRSEYMRIPMDNNGMRDYLDKMALESFSLPIFRWNGMRIRRYYNRDRVISAIINEWVKSILSDANIPNFFDVMDRYMSWRAIYKMIPIRFAAEPRKISTPWDTRLKLFSHRYIDNDTMMTIYLTFTNYRHCS